ncbi:MAG: hypothetical protein JEZ04_05110 [Spirochaetales bacterium]|nr:hypothetical protein [Spirochaetales bacterium]
MKLVKTEKLSDNNFDAYGWAVRKPERPMDVENDQLIFWDNMADLSNFAGNGLLGFLEVKRIPIKMEMMDLLTESLRIYLSVDGRPSVQFVALNNADTNETDLSTLKAFYLENGDGVVIKENVWHWTPYALTETACFAMGLRNDIMKSSGGVYTVDDSKVKYFTLPEPVGIEL